MARVRSVYQKKSSGYRKYRSRYGPKSYSKRGYKRSKGYGKYRRSSKYGRKGRYRRSSYRSKFSRRYKKYKKAKQFYKHLKPSADKDTMKLNRKPCSMRFIEYYRPALGNLKAGLADTHIRGLTSLICRKPAWKALNILACLIEGVPYVRYSDTKSDTQANCRIVYQCLMQYALEFKIQMLEPGHYVALKMAKRFVRDATKRQMNNEMHHATASVLKEHFAISTRRLDAALGVLQGVSHAHMAMQGVDDPAEAAAMGPRVSGVRRSATQAGLHTHFADDDI